MSEQKARLRDLRRTRQTHGNEIKVHVRAIADIDKEIRSIETEHNEKLMVSDHAVVRYLERTGLVDIRGLRDKISQTCRTSAREGHWFKEDGDSIFLGQGVRVTTTLSLEQWLRSGAKIKERCK